MRRNGDRHDRAAPGRSGLGLRLAAANCGSPAADSCSLICNYSADAGAGSQVLTNISESPGWRAALLGTVAAGALWLGLPRHAKAGPDACTTVGTTATCQGNQSAGVSSNTDFNPAVVDTLNVSTLMDDITPGLNVDGIYFHRTGAGNNIVINSDTTPFSIIVNGVAGADGIDAESDAAITIDHMGNIDASLGRHGIFAQVNAAGTGGLSITSEGDVTGAQRGIHAYNYGTGALEIVANGDVQGINGTGIYARNAGTNLTITSQAVNSGGTGISATNRFGALIITAHGDVVADQIGVFAYNRLTGSDLTVTTQSVHSRYTGIQARNAGPGALTIIAHGDVITSDSAAGIDAENIGVPGTNLSVTAQRVIGTINGIRAVNNGTGSLEIVANGDVAITEPDPLYRNNGIFALNSNHSSTTLTITTQGVAGGRYGIFAQHLGTGALTINVNGDVTGDVVLGGHSGRGILAQHAFGSQPPHGDIDIRVGAGANVVGAAVGIQIIGGNGTVTNYGTIRSLVGITGEAVLGDVLDDRIDNFGVVTGSVLLGAGVNAFNNMDGGRFDSGPIVDLGTGTLTNHGTLAPGGADNVLTTVLTGNLTQPGSVFAVDIDGPNADRVTVSGNASMAGLVTPKALNLDGTTRWTIMTSGAGTIDNGIAVNDTSIVDYELIFPSATEMVLAIAEVDFSLEGHNRNETAIADNLNAVFASGDASELGSLLAALANLPNIGALANALDQLSPEVYLDTEIATLFSSLAFTNSLMTCPTRDGAAAFIKEGQCVWARLSGRQFDQDATFQALGFDERSFEVAGGVQGALGPVWRVGLAGAYEESFLDTSTFASSDADRIHGGAVLKFNPGALLLAGAVSGGWGWYDTERPINFPGFSALAQSDNEIGYVNGRLRAAYQLGSGNWYAKPMVDLDVTHINLDGVNETGAGAVGLKVRGNDETVFSATPALELGTQFDGPGGTLVRPYIRGGATFFDDPDFVLLASFEGAPGGVGPFRIASSTDDVLANVGAGVDVIGVEGASFRIYYEGRFGDLVEQHAGGIKATLPF